MPKTKEQIEAEVRAFYKSITDAIFLDDTTDDVETFTVSEEEIRMAVESYDEQATENAKKYLDMREKSVTLMKKICEDNGIVPEVPFERIVAFRLDMSGTPQANEKNKAFLQKISTRENFKEFLLEQLDLAKKMDISLLENANIKTAAELCINPETGPVLNAAFVAPDILSSAKSLGIEVPQDTEDLLNYNTLLMALPFDKLGIAQKNLSKPEFACMNPKIAVVKHFMDNPNRYASKSEAATDAYQNISEMLKHNSDLSPFKELCPALKLNRIIEQAGIPKKVEILEGLGTGRVVSYKAADGKK